ncbi:YuzD family protein [Pontibacillus litoralis]|uniref:Disulfide oxidoreductase n=1 Tax=Pontibacillus litoralis JSM 072002 TaxID=1385512 RepID=A0A0A5G0S0_9BACI|nr:YuzD family protein [Pontibacillus litoralis]KGX86711.1 disulfide oxidoreductase [Pontibacillus litoralis JSM 072002]
MDKVVLTVYGAKTKCASCVNAPGAYDTYEWLQAAINRKYETHEIQYVYVDIEQRQTDKEHQHFIEKIEQEEYFYPLVVLNGEVIGEGNPRLKVIYQKLESSGVLPKE